jgi:3-methyladenine DNA glycosylase AlkD
MSKDEVMKQLEKFGTDSIKQTLLRHGAKEPFFGVKVADLKTLQKKLKKDYELSMALYDTGNSDAMYLAGLIADESKMTKIDLQHWADNAYRHMISEYTVAWVASESKYGAELALKWIDSKDERIATAGWATLSGLASIRADEELDIQVFDKLMDRVEKEIHAAPNRVRYTMNGFIIAVGCYIVSLSEKAKAISKKIGKITVNMGDTACKVPDAAEYIDKTAKANRLGKKRKDARC